MRPMRNNITSNGMKIEEAREVCNSTYWGFVKNEIDYRIALKTKELRRCKDQRTLDTLNAFIDALETFKRLPEDVIDRET